MQDMMNDLGWPFGQMRDATAEERDGIKRYIEGISMTVKGCSYIDENGSEAQCIQNVGGLCRAGAVLTSSMLGAHPADCPMITKKEENSFGKRSGNQ